MFQTNRKRERERENILLGACVCEATACKSIRETKQLVEKFHVELPPPPTFQPNRFLVQHPVRWVFRDSLSFSPSLSLLRSFHPFSLVPSFFFSYARSRSVTSSTTHGNSRDFICNTDRVAIWISSGRSWDFLSLARVASLIARRLIVETSVSTRKLWFLFAREMLVRSIKFDKRGIFVKFSKYRVYPDFCRFRTFTTIRFPSC